jgi:hypothetical protein
MRIHVSTATMRRDDKLTRSEDLQRATPAIINTLPHHALIGQCSDCSLNSSKQYQQTSPRQLIKPTTHPLTPIPNTSNFPFPSKGTRNQTQHLLALAVQESSSKLHWRISEPTTQQPFSHATEIQYMQYFHSSPVLYRSHFPSPTPTGFSTKSPAPRSMKPTDQPIPLGAYEGRR